MRWVFVGLLVPVLAACAAPGAMTDAALATQEFRIPSQAPGVQLYVRNKAPASMVMMEKNRMLLFRSVQQFLDETAP